MSQSAAGTSHQSPSARPLRLKVALLAGLWTILVAASLLWNLYLEGGELDEVARTQARMAFDKDLIFRRWNAMHGGVYAAVTPQTQPNPYLSVPERDITTPSGRQLTLINPAYMTRLVHELGRLNAGMEGHITSLRPIRPENAPDPWETQALQAFAQGEQEVSARVRLDGRPFLRLMRPLPYEKVCQPCHGHQGYELGQVRGGISVAVPLEPLLAAHHRHQSLMILTHALLWTLGLAGLFWASRGLKRRQQARLAAEAAREATLAELRQALEQVRTLSGLLPICASCKRIRDQDGRWQGLETYISQRSQASFSHGICPQCARRLYPELADALADDGPGRPGGPA